MSTKWYETTSGEELEQGDLLISCPIFRVEVNPTGGDEAAAVIQEDHDVIVLTQTCDLVNDKVQDILVAAVLSYEQLIQRFADDKPNILSKDFRRAAVDGNLPSYFLLPERAETPTLQWSLVDFHDVFSLPKKLAQQVVGDGGERLRLVPPYKEHMAQAFARYIMRVGLPTTLHEFTSVDAPAIRARLKT